VPRATHEPGALLAAFAAAIAPQAESGAEIGPAAAQPGGS